MTFDFSKYIVEKTSRNDFTDNDACRVAAYLVQNGHCYVTGGVLKRYHRELHHRKPRYYDGEDTPVNLILLNKTLHKMVHAWSEYEFVALRKTFPLTADQLKMVNQLRYEAHRPLIAC